MMEIESFGIINLKGPDSRNWYARMPIRGRTMSEPNFCL